MALTLLLQACNNKKKDTAQGAGDPFYQQIDHSFLEMKTEPAGYVNKPFGAKYLRLVVTPVHSHLIAANRNESIYLYSAGGDTLLSKIGRKGKGPGEFLTISQLYIGDDHALYVLDGKLSRVTKFKIENKQMHYVTTFNIKPPTGMRVKDIYTTKYGNFGVFQLNNYKTHEGSFNLYRLSSHFGPVKKLLNMPGDQKIKANKHFYIPWLPGRNTYWDLKGKWFYYISSRNSKINKYNLKTGQLQTHRYFTLPIRTNTKNTKEFLRKWKAPLIKNFPAIKDAIRKMKSIAMFDNIHVSGNQLFFNIYYAGGKGGRIIYVNQTNGQVKVIKTASVISRFGVDSNNLYGITTSKKGSQIKIIHLH
jgi:hypothetical protein